MKSFIIRICILICIFNSAYSLRAQSVTVQYPNGFEDLMVGSRHGIIWNYSGFNSVRIELSTNNGLNWSTIAGANNLPNTQSYFNWLIPNQISGQCRIRIIDNVNATINDISNNTFSITPQPVINPDKYLGGPLDGYNHAKFNHTPVTVNYPNGGDVFVVGTNQYITWTYNSLNLVDVEYSLDNGSTWTNISTVSAIQGFVIWNVPFIQSNTCLIRVIDIFNSVNVDQSDSIFSVIGIPLVNLAKYSGGGRDGYHAEPNVNPLRVLAPNGGETLVSGSIMNITWAYASLNNVNVFLSTDNGSNWTSLATNIPATNSSFNYTIPVTQTSSTQCLVRVDDVLNTTIKDTSNAVFTIQSTSKTFGGSYDGYSYGSNVQRLSLIYPNGGDTIYSGSRVSIVWSYQSMNLVQPAFSIDNGSNWTNIGAPVMATQQMINWLVPATPSTQCLVRVFDMANPNLFDESNTVFTIPANPVIDVVKYSGGTFDGYHFGGPRIDLLNPDGGEIYYASTPMDIHWRYYNSTNTSPPNIAIELSTNSGLTWTTTVSGSVLSTTGFFRYTVPAINTTQARIRVRDLTNGVISDSSRADFEIISALPIVNANKYSGGSLDGYAYSESANPIIVTAPNGGEVYYQAGRVSITWQYSSFNQVQVSASTDNGTSWFNIGSPLQGVTGILNWNPSLSNISAQCLVRVVDVNNPTVRDSSNAVFSIIATPVLANVKYEGGSFDGYAKNRILQISGPNGGEVFNVGSSISLGWNYNSQNILTIEVSTDNGSNWTILANNIPATNRSYNWVPNLSHVSNTCLFRITDNSNTSIFDVSDAVFQIQSALNPLIAKHSGGALDGYSMGSSSGIITLTYPNGSEVFHNGDRVSIRWDYNNSQTVQLAYSSDNGSNWVNIASTAGNNGFLNWNVPSLNSTQMLVRVFNTTITSERDSSNAVFTVLPSRTITNDKFSGGGYDGYVSQSNLSPDPLRYSGGSFDGYSSGSNRPLMTLLNPIGGEQWFVGSVQNIAWRYSSINNIQIQISVNGGSSYSTIATIPAMDGTFNYIVPATPSNLCLVRITDVVTGLRDSSAAFFEILPVPTIDLNKYQGGSFDGYAMRSSLSPVTVITPNGGDNLFVGSQYTIIWSYNSQNNVRIEFSSDGGSTYSTIIASVPAQQRMYNWLVPGTLSNTCRIRVRDVLSSGIFDVSDANFSIINLPIVNNDKYSGGSLDGYADADACVSPIATLSGGANLCLGNSTVLTITQSGTMPYAFTYSDGTTQTSISGINFTPFFLVLTPSQTATYSLVSVSNCLGAGTVNGSAVIQVSPFPQASLSGSANICSGGSTTLSVQLIGLAPWTFAYSDGTSQFTVTGATVSPFLISVTPLVNTNYNLISVSTACGTGTVSGTASITINPPPTAGMAGTNTICSGASTLLQVNFTGGGPWNLTWTDGTSPVITSGITSNPYFISVTPLANTTYAATALNTTCAGTASGSAAITVNPVPLVTLTGSQVICPGNAANLSFTLAGSAPWNLNYSDGTSSFSVTGITSSPFIVSHSPIATRTYTLGAYSDALCAGTQTGSAAVVQVNTPPTASISGTQSVCTGNPALLTVTLSGPSPWNIAWTDGTTPASISGITQSPYLLSVTPVSNSTYTLTQVNSNCAGTVSGFAAISLVGVPTATLTGNQTICPGGSAQLSLALTGGGPWAVAYTDGTSNAQITGIAITPYVFSVTPTGAVSYSLTSVTASCPGTVAGIATIQNYTQPLAAISGTQTICQGSNAQVSFILAGIQPWTLTYSRGLTPVTISGITSSPFVVTVTPSAHTTYSVVSIQDNFCTASGGSGTAIVNVDPVPTAQISGSGTVCAGSPVTMSVLLTGVAPWGITYTDGTTLQSISGISSSPFQFSVSAASTRTYTLTQVLGSCVGTVSGQGVLTVTPSPTAQMTGTTTVCPGNPAQLSVNFTSTSPWNITYSDGSASISVSGVTNNPYLISVTPTTTRTYALTFVQNNLCTGVATGAPVVTVSPAPSAIASGSTQICSGNSTLVSVAFTGAGPWDIIWTDGTTPVPVNGITSNPYLISVSPVSSTTYSLLSVISGCAGTTAGNAAIQVSTPPSASISGGAVICTGGSTAISVQFTGAGPWNYSYTDGTLQTQVLGITSSPHVFVVSPSATRTYSLVSMSGLCAGTIAGNATVTVNNQLPNAVLSGNNTICTLNPTTLSFNMTGNSPWNLVYTDGVVPFSVSGITATPLLVVVSPSQNTTYSLLNINNVCGNGIVFGTAQIQTSTGPTAQMTGGTSICSGGQSTLSVALNGPSPWNFTWTDGTTPTTINGITASPFLIQVSPTFAVTYSATAVTGACNGTASGTVALNVLSSPVATLTGTQTICSGQNAQLTVSLSGAGPFNVTWTDGTTPVTISGITAATHIIQVNPQQNRQYQLVSVSGACIGSVSGVANITVLPSPTVQLSAPANFCAGAQVNLTYALTGTQPWTIIYNDGVNPVTITGITTTPFVTSVSPVGNTTYTVSDLADGICVISNPGAQVSVTELAAPTAILSGSNTVCAGTVFNASILLTGAFPWNVSYTDGTLITTRTGITSSPFLLPISASANRTFTLVSVNGGGCSGSVSGQATLGIFPSPSANIAGNATICPGNGTAISVSLSGIAPWNLTYTDGSVVTAINGITSSNYLLAVSPSTTRTYTLVSVQDGQCSGIVSGSSVVQVSAPPAASISGNRSICIGGNALLSVQLMGAGPWDIAWTDGTNTSQQTGITSSPYQFAITPTVNTTYNLVSVISGCPGTVTGSAIVQVSAVPTAILTGGGAICSGGNTALSFNLTGQAPWQMTFSDGTIQNTISGIQTSPYVLNVSPNQTSTYTLMNVSGLCNGTVSGNAVVVVNNLLPNAVLSGTQSICTGNFAQLTVHLSGNAPWSIVYTDGAVLYSASGISSSPYVFQVSPLTSTTYTILNVNNACGNGVVFGNALVSSTVTPVATLSGSATICPGGVAQLSVNMTGNAPYNITYTDGVTPVQVTGITSNPYLISVSPVVQTTYLLTAFSNQCIGSFSGSSIVSVLTGGPTATILGTQTICNGNQAQMSINLTGTPPWSFVFSNGINPTSVNNIILSPYVFAVSPVFNTTYSMVSVTDANCIGNASPTPALVALTSPPIAGISGAHTICSGGTATLTTVLTGSSPWTITYTDGISPVTITGITNSPYLLSVSPSVSSTYILTQVIGRCSGTTSGQATVQVNVGGPQAVLGAAQTICSGTGTSVVMQLSGQAPWNLTWTDGTNSTAVTGINSSPFVVAVTPLSSRSYSLTQLSDALCAGTLPITGTNITVIPQPLAVITGTQSICLGSQATFSVNLSGGGPWNLTWTDGTNPITVTGITATPYIFTSIPTVNSTYSLLAVSNLCSGNVSGTALVSVLPALSATISGSGTVCPGNGAAISVSFAGTGPWNITWTDGTSPTTVTGVTQNPFVFSLSPLSSTSYRLVSVSNPNCSGSVFGSGNIQVLQVPTASISGTQTVCQGVVTTIPVTLSGSFPMTLRYSNGVFNTTITGINTTPYLIQVTPTASATYTINALNNQCSGTFSGFAVIAVNGSPNAAIGGAQGVCVGNQALINVNLTGSSPWIFNYTDGTLTTTVTGITSSPYQLSVTPFTNTAYTITRVSDQFCTSNGNFGTSLVSIVTAPGATVTGPGSVCAGNTAPINFFLTGASPWDIQYSDGTSTFAVTGISTSPYLLNASPTTSTQYVLTSITDQNCVSTGLTASHIVNVTQGPAATLSGNQQICSGQQATLTFTLTGTAPWSVTYLQGAQVVTVPGIVNPVFTLNVNPGSTTVYTLQSVADALCTGSVSGSATVAVISPPTAGITGSTSVCSGGSVNLSVNLTGSAPWTIAWSDGVNTNVVNNIASSPYVLAVTPNVTTFYTITSVSSGACVGTATGNAVVTVGAPPVGSFGSGTAICAGQTAIVPLTLSGIGPWSVSYSNGVTTTVVTGITTGQFGLQVTPLATTTYTLLSVTDGSCAGSVGSANAIVSVSLNLSSLSMAGSSAVCIGNLANLVFNFTGSSPWTISYSDGINTQTITGINSSPYIHNVAPIVSTTYTPLSVSNACGSGTVSGVATIDVSSQAPTSVFTYSINGYQVNLNNGSIGGSLYLWNFGDGNTSTAYNTSHTYTGPGFYTITLTVTNACGTFTSSQTIFINYGVSIDADQLDKAIQIYPNPSNGLFTVGISGIAGTDVEIKIVSAEGKSLVDEKHFDISDDMQIPVDISNQAAGVYVLKVITPDGLEIYRKLTVIRN